MVVCDVERQNQRLYTSAKMTLSVNVFAKLLLSHGYFVGDYIQ